MKTSKTEGGGGLLKGGGTAAQRNPTHPIHLSNLPPRGEGRGIMDKKWEAGDFFTGKIFGKFATVIGKRGDYRLSCAPKIATDAYKCRTSKISTHNHLWNFYRYSVYLAAIPSVPATRNGIQCKRRKEVPT